MQIDPAQLPDIATLFVAAAVHPDGRLSDVEVRLIVDLISEVSAHEDEAVIRNIVLGALEAFPETYARQTEVVQHVSQVLAAALPRNVRRQILLDLQDIARSDGIVLDEERSFVEGIAALWNENPPELDQAVEIGEGDKPGEVWTSAHDLSLVYLQLAHGTDDELSRTEMNAMVGVLRSWLPDLDQTAILETLRQAMDRYAEGDRDELIEAAVSRLGRTLSHDQLEKALSDLVSIANADGVFLDDEEDLIIRLQTEWGVDPDSLYD
jgi:uncharacterized tellurite resistance protein B-like protein